MDQDLLSKYTVQIDFFKIFGIDLTLSAERQVMLGSKAPPSITTNEQNPRFLIGKNAEINWQIYKASDGLDTIFHLDKFPSPYVILNIPIELLTKEQINAAALLCKSKSKYKNITNIGIMYTPISNTNLGIRTGEFIIKSNRKKKIIFV